MKPIDFTERTTIIAKDQPQYIPLPAHVEKEDGTITFCWKLTWKERLKLLFTGKIWHQVLTFRTPLQPQKLSLTKPFLVCRKGK